MKIHQRLAVTVLIVVATATLTACGNSDPDQEKADHVWKDKTEAIDKARDVQRQLDESRKQ